MSETVDREIVEAIEPREPSKPQHVPTRRGGRRGSEKTTVEAGGKKAATARKNAAVPKANPKGIKEGAVSGLQVMGWVLPPKEIWPIDEQDPAELEALEQFCTSLASLINRLPEGVRAMIMTLGAGGGWAKDVFGLVKSLQRLALPRLMMMKLYQADPAAWQTMTPPAQEPAPAWTQAA